MDDKPPEIHDRLLKSPICDLSVAARAPVWIILTKILICTAKFNNNLIRTFSAGNPRGNSMGTAPPGV